jgi:hypothetical protein
VAHARAFGRVDRGLVLRDAPLQIRGADEQQSLGSRERFAQRLHVVEVREAHLRPARRELRELAGRSRRENDVAGGALGQHELGDPPAQLTRCARDRQSCGHARRQICVRFGVFTASASISSRNLGLASSGT